VCSSDLFCAVEATLVIAAGAVVPVSSVLMSDSPLALMLMLVAATMAIIWVMP
jgi:hypothetical protein